MPELSESRLNEHFAVVNSLGNTVIIETFKAAAFYISHSSGVEGHSRSFLMQFREAQECFIFIQGTGLDILINRFGLAYNPDNLRDTFNYCVRRSA